MKYPLRRPLQCVLATDESSLGDDEETGARFVYDATSHHQGLNLRFGRQDRNPHPACKVNRRIPSG